jgi:uncharacterized protein (TIGR03437 family)
LTLQTEGWISEGIPGYMLPAQPIPNAQAVPVFSVVNAGSREAGPIAPGELVSIFGHDLAHARVRIDGAAARVMSAEENEIRAIVPLQVAGKRQVTVQVNTESTEVPVAAARPALFAADPYGKGELLMAWPGEEVVLPATGLGQDLPISVTVGGLPAELLSRTDQDGKSALRIRIPFGLEPNTSVPVTVRAGEYTSQAGVALTMR